MACSLTVHYGSVGSALSPHAGVICWLGQQHTIWHLLLPVCLSACQNDLQELLCAQVQQAGSSSCLSLSSDTWISPAIIWLRDSCQPQGSGEVLKKNQPPTLPAPNQLFVLFVCVIDLSAYKYIYIYISERGLASLPYLIPRNVLSVAVRAVKHFDTVCTLQKGSVISKMAVNIFTVPCQCRFEGGKFLEMMTQFSSFPPCLGCLGGKKHLRNVALQWAVVGTTAVTCLSAYILRSLNMVVRH